MCVSAEKNEAVQWGEMMPDAELIQRGLDLAEKKYSNPEYTRQR
jgi:hypothetical protein